MLSLNSSQKINMKNPFSTSASQFDDQFAGSLEFLETISKVYPKKIKARAVKEVKTKQVK